MAQIVSKVLKGEMRPKGGMGAFAGEIPGVESILEKLDLKKNDYEIIKQRLEAMGISGKRLEHFMGAIRIDGGLVRISARAALSMENPDAYEWACAHYNKYTDFRRNLSEALEKCMHEKINQKMFVLDKRKITFENKEFIRLKKNEKKNSVNLGKGGGLPCRCVKWEGKSIRIIEEEELIQNRPKDYENAMKKYGIYAKLVEAVRKKLAEQGYMETIKGVYIKLKKAEVAEKTYKKISWGEYVEKIMRLKKERMKKIENNEFALDRDAAAGSNYDLKRFEREYPGGMAAIKERLISEGHITSISEHVLQIREIAKKYSV